MKLSQSKCHGFTFYRSGENNANGNVKLHVYVVSYFEPPNVSKKCTTQLRKARVFYVIYLRAYQVDRGEQQTVSIDDDNNQTMYTANECTIKLTAT